MNFEEKIKEFKEHVINKFNKTNIKDLETNKFFFDSVISPSAINLEFYNKVNSLSHEAKEKLSKIQPVTISQASRISGVSPSDISVVLVYMGR